MKSFNHPIKPLLVIIFFMIALFPSISEATTRNSIHQPLKESAALLRRNPVRNDTWSMVPTVVICNSDMIEISKVESAIGWWRERGYDIGIIVVNIPGSICHQAGWDGVITIEGPDAMFDFDYLAITHRKASRNEILSARIQLRAYSKKDRILEHEIGHALGWSHCNRRGHIMNPEWSRGGWNDIGLVTDVD